MIRCRSLDCPERSALPREPRLPSRPRPQAPRDSSGAAAFPADAPSLPALSAFARDGNSWPPVLRFRRSGRGDLNSRLRGSHALSRTRKQQTADRVRRAVRGADHRVRVSRRRREKQLTASCEAPNCTGRPLPARNPFHSTPNLPPVRESCGQRPKGTPFPCRHAVRDARICVPLRSGCPSRRATPAIS